jgi:hypothetical protein
MPETSTKKSGAAVAKSDDKSVASFMKPATILFGLVFLALGGCVLLFIKFRSMDKQVRLLTTQVAQVPSEDDFRMAQESWAHQFLQKQTKQTTLIMERLDALAEVTRTHANQIVTRQEAHSALDDCSVDSDMGPTSHVDTSAQFNIDDKDIQLTDTNECDEGVCPTETVIASQSCAQAGEEVETVTGEEVETVTGEEVEKVTSEEVEKVTSEEVEELASEDDNDMPAITTEEPMAQPHIPNAFAQSLESPKVKRETKASKKAATEDVLESSLDLDGDESGMESEASN